MTRTNVYSEDECSGVCVLLYHSIIEKEVTVIPNRRPRSDKIVIYDSNLGYTLLANSYLLIIV